MLRTYIIYLGPKDVAKMHQNSKLLSSSYLKCKKLIFCGWELIIMDIIYMCVYIYMYIRISEYDAIYRSKPRITVHSIVISFNVVQNTAKKEWYTGDEEGEIALTFHYKNYFCASIF